MEEMEAQTSNGEVEVVLALRVDDMSLVNLQGPVRARAVWRGTGTRLLRARLLFSKGRPWDRRLLTQAPRPPLSRSL